MLVGIIQISAIHDLHRNPSQGSSFPIVQVGKQLLVVVQEERNEWDAHGDAHRRVDALTIQRFQKASMKYSMVFGSITLSLLLIYLFPAIHYASGYSQPQLDLSGPNVCTYEEE